MKNATKGMQVLRIILCVLTLATIVFIFYNSLQTAEASSNSSGWVMRFLNNICVFLGIEPFFNQEIVRTLAHFCEFGLLGVLSASTSLSMLGCKFKVPLVSLATVAVVALIDECLQLFSNGRAFQLSDIAIDISGGFLGIVGVFIIALLVSGCKIKRN